jgi:membrane protein implicated in regulation of membrane protease activity
MDSLAHVLSELLFWHWLALGLVLLIFEVAIGLGFLFWVGLAALITGFVVFIVPTLIWPYQCLLFAVIAIINTIVWWRAIRKNASQTDQPRLNRRAEHYINRCFTLGAPIVNNLGKIEVDDSLWRVFCEKDLPANTQVEVYAVDGVVLKVKEKMQDKA